MNNLKSFFIVAGIISILPACSVIEVAPSQVEAEVRTYARYVPERNEDFAWENDLVAFRMYGPFARDFAENAGLDCWLKRVKTPIIDKWYKQELEQGKTYHQDWGEGLDNYHVGSSAGCGSSALWLNGKREPLETYTEWEIIEQSPEKTKFALMYEREIEGVVYRERKEIEIKLGQRVFKASSTFWKDGQLAVGLPISVGLSTHDEAAISNWDEHTGMLSTWEVKDDYGLGTGVLLDPKRIEQFKLVPSLGIRDAGHVLAITHTNKQGQIEYYAGYGWEKAQEITSFAQWKQYLKNFSKQQAKY